MGQEADGECRVEWGVRRDQEEGGDGGERGEEGTNGCEGGQRGRGR